MREPESPVSQPPARPRLRHGLLVLGALALAGLCLAQAIPSGPAPAPATVPAASTPAASASRPARASASRPGTGRTAVKQATHPHWRELQPAQQQALAPLAPKWDTLSEAQKRKWIALSSNFPRMPPAEQAKLHSRMAEWVGLSQQQRVEARLNFGESQKISPDDRKAKWEAYQNLSPDEKKRLAANAPKPPTTAAAVKPVPAGKLAAVPHQQASAPLVEGRTPRITIGRQVDHNTLLPHRAAAPAATPVPASAPAAAASGTH